MMTIPHYPDKTGHPGLFGPEDFLTYHYRGDHTFPDRYIIIYDPGLLKRIQSLPGMKRLGRIIPGADLFTCGKTGIAAMKGVGAPHAAAALEELIALGGGRFLSIGTAGGLQSRGVFVCEKALRDEGTSYHYLPAARFSLPDADLTAELAAALAKADIGYQRAPSWTTDAPYRETRPEVDMYRREGIATVEMESAALFAVAAFRNVRIAAAFVVSDLLDREWEPAFHHADTKASLDTLFQAALDLLNG
ncbi:nucleoside phosphorylase [bacterium]|nr:nucleoside phosphorylase [bacterium]